jgi:hypothetical protein
MDFLWHINVEEMLGDLTLTTFLILLAASIAVVSLMVLFPLIAALAPSEIGVFAADDIRHSQVGDPSAKRFLKGRPNHREQRRLRFGRCCEEGSERHEGVQGRG